jgi:hypothetical protein
MQTRDAEAEEMPKKSFGDLIDLLPFPFGATLVVGRWDHPCGRKLLRGKAVVLTWDSLFEIKCK